jgi:hypothetical protein
MSARQAKERWSAMGSTFAATRGALRRADDLFVSRAQDLEGQLMQVTARLAAAALAVVPAYLQRCSRAFTLLSRRTLRFAQQDNSVMAAAVPAAAQRTSSILEGWRQRCLAMSRELIGAVGGGGRTLAETLEEEYRTIGKDVSEALREGLDPYLLGRAVHQHLREIRRLEKRRLRKANKMKKVAR